MICLRCYSSQSKKSPAGCSHLTDGLHGRAGIMIVSGCCSDRHRDDYLRKILKWRSYISSTYLLCSFI